MEPFGDELGRGRRKRLKIIPNVGRVRGCPVSGSSARHGSPLWLLESSHSFMYKTRPLNLRFHRRRASRLELLVTELRRRDPMLPVPNLRISHKSPLCSRFASLWHRSLGVRAPIRANGLAQLRNSVKLKAGSPCKRHPCSEETLSLFCIRWGLFPFDRATLLVQI